MLKRAVLTGATGFLGKAILEKLLESQYLPFILVRKDSNLENISKLLPFCKLVYYETLQGSELQILLKEAIGADLFIHCAWKGVAGMDREQATQITYNLDFTINAVILANLIKCKKWVGIGSQAEYGTVNNVAIENGTPIHPLSAYGRAKVACYWAAAGLCDIFGLEMLWCRVFSLYGVNDNPNAFIPYVIQSFLEGKTPCLTRCEQKWDYLHVKDGAEALLSLAQSKETGIFNIGSGKTVLLKDVVDFLKQRINANLTVNYGAKLYSANQIMHLQADISKLKKATQWEPKINLEAGLSEMIQVHPNYLAL